MVGWAVAEDNTAARRLLHIELNITSLVADESSCMPVDVPGCMLEHSVGKTVNR